MTFLFIIGIAAILWCLWIGLPGCIKRYFAALLIQGFVTTLAYKVWGNLDRRYILAYCFATAPVLLSCIEIAWRSLEKRAYRFRAIAIPVLLSLTICRIAESRLSKPLTISDSVVLVQALALLFSGMVTGGAAPYLKRKWTFFVLGIFWIVRALFDLGYTLHFDSWQKLNAWFPAALCAVAFTLIGIIQSKRKEVRDVLDCTA